MEEFKYIELYPSYNKGKPVRLSFNDTIRSAKKKIKGVTHRNLVFVTHRHTDIYGVRGIKADLQMRLRLRDRLNLTDDILWGRFRQYRYCMIQLYNIGAIDLIAICNIDKLGNLSIEDKRKSKIITNNGEISLYDLCMNLKIFGSGTNVNGMMGLVVSDDIFEKIEISLFNNTLCFIRRTLENEDLLTFKSTSQWIEIMRILGMEIIKH